MEEKSRKTANKVAAGAASAVAAAGLLVNTVVTDPATLLKPSGEAASDPSHVCVVDGVDRRSYILETEENEPYTLRERICLRIQSWPLPVRALVLLPLWGIGEFLITLLSALWNSPIGQIFLHFLLEAALLTGLDHRRRGGDHRCGRAARLLLGAVEGVAHRTACGHGLCRAASAVLAHTGQASAAKAEKEKGRADRGMIAGYPAAGIPVSSGQGTDCTDDSESAV